MSANALEIRGLVKSYPGFRLGPLDLTVPEGAIYGFVGPNGSGKTTTIDLIFGMGGKDGGDIQVLGLHHLRDEVAMKQQVGYVSPELNFQSWKKVSRVIGFVSSFYPTWDDAYCERLLGAFHIAHGDRIAALSFGTRIKLALVLALSWRPRLLVLDEPTVGLDAISKQQVYAELLAAVCDEGRTVFVSSHGIDDVERFADHVGMLKGGRLVLEGTTTDVLERFRLVDVQAPDSIGLETLDGVYVQRRQANRYSVLVDRRATSVESLVQRGAQALGESPVTLEELFVAVGKA